MYGKKESEFFNTQNVDAHLVLSSVYMGRVNHQLSIESRSGKP
jgi:hypothetical protein